MTDTGVFQRFRATMAANMLGAAAGFLASVFLARGLGAAGFGDYNFLIAGFTAFGAAIDLGSSSAFYTFMSQGLGQARHFRAFASWTALRFLLIAGLLALLPGRWLAGMWVGHGRPVVLLAFCAFFFSVPLRAFLIQTAESVRRTAFIQFSLAALAVLEAAAIFILWRLDILNVAWALALLALEYAALLVFFLSRFDWRLLAGEGGRPWPELLRQYASYCAPLVLLSLVSFPCDFADRWMLQRFGGSTQQGFFSFGQQFATIALLATVSLLNIFWKEIAEAHRSGDLERVKDLYRRASRALFFAAACGAGLLIPHSGWILTLVAGGQFAGGAAALGLMLLYPCFQSIGQLNGAYFYATEDTRTHVAISSLSLFAGLPLTYLALAPRTAWVPGLGLGAAGLAARWALLQIAAVSAQSWIIARRQKTRSDLAHPLLVLGSLLAIGFGAKLVGAALARVLPAAGGFTAFGLSGLAYAACVAALVYRFPGRAGTSVEEIKRVLIRPVFLLILKE